MKKPTVAEWKQSNIVYINKETQSLMSEHDYKHLSTDQQNKMVAISLQKPCENNTTTKPITNNYGTTNSSRMVKGKTNVFGFSS